MPPIILTPLCGWCGQSTSDIFVVCSACLRDPELPYRQRDESPITPAMEALLVDEAETWAAGQDPAVASVVADAVAARGYSYERLTDGSGLRIVVTLAAADMTWTELGYVAP